MKKVRTTFVAAFAGMIVVLFWGLFLPDMTEGAVVTKHTSASQKKYKSNWNRFKPVAKPLKQTIQQKSGFNKFGKQMSFKKKVETSGHNPKAPSTVSNPQAVMNRKSTQLYRYDGKDKSTGPARYLKGGYGSTSGSSVKSGQSFVKTNAGKQSAEGVSGKNPVPGFKAGIVTKTTKLSGLGLKNSIEKTDPGQGITTGKEGKPDGTQTASPSSGGKTGPLKPDEGVSGKNPVPGFKAGIVTKTTKLSEKELKKSEDGVAKRESQAKADPSKAQPGDKAGSSETKKGSKEDPEKHGQEEKAKNRGSGKIPDSDKSKQKTDDKKKPSPDSSGQQKLAKTSHGSLPESNKSKTTGWQDAVEKAKTQLEKDRGTGWIAEGDPYLIAGEWYQDYTKYNKAQGCPPPGCPVERTNRPLLLTPLTKAQRQELWDSPEYQQQKKYNDIAWGGGGPDRPSWPNVIEAVGKLLWKGAKGLGSTAVGTQQRAVENSGQARNPFADALDSMNPSHFQKEPVKTKSPVSEGGGGQVGANVGGVVGDTISGSFDRIANQ